MATEINCFGFYRDTLIKISSDKAYGTRVVELATMAIQNHSISKEEITQVTQILKKRIRILNSFREEKETPYFERPPRLNEKGVDAVNKMTQMVQEIELIQERCDER